MPGRFKKSTIVQKLNRCNSFIYKWLINFSHSTVEKVEFLPITHIEKINFIYTHISLNAKKLHFLHSFLERVDFKRVKWWRNVFQKSTGVVYE